MSRTRAAALGALSVLAVALGLALVRAGGPAPSARPSPSPAPVTGTAVPTGARTQEALAVRLLSAWDRQRSAAWADGSPRRLRDLYIPGAGAGAADARLLARYTSRGLRVTGMRMQLLAVEVRAHRPGRWDLRVTDRLVGERALRGRHRVRLPRDGPSTRLVTLVRGADRRWRVAEVADGA